MGIYCIAIYSSEDAQALHVKLADEAHCVGPAEAHLSYLNQAAILKIALATQAEAIHPGYGFLSENADFAAACESQQICFIGAPAAAIRAMGSKIGAKQLMEQAGVPLLPGYHGGNQQADLLLLEAIKIGFPILIKASAGGGGKGMRVVTQEQDFLEDLAGCQREAKKSFGNDEVLLEKYLTQPRHIEIQIFADQHGNCLHLFERDCSIQRRHQKVLEEAPAPHLSDEIRHQMGQAAIKAARSVNYVGAGTIEFLYDQGQFYFMEMNTRLQVEHPVTEAITGLDLVEWQLKVASGLPLPLKQEQLKILGHAIEVRVYAEDPEHGFLPSTGTLNAMLLPKPAAGVRLDTGIQVNDKIGIFYDPMLAKLICFSGTRAAACQLMQQALSHYVILGLKTNLNFLSRLIQLDAYQQGFLATDFIEKNHAMLLPCLTLPPAVLLFATAYQLHQLTIHHNQQDPWQTLTGWQNCLTSHAQWQFSWQNHLFDVRVTQEDKHWRVQFDQHEYLLDAHFTIEGNQWQLRVTQDSEQSMQAILVSNGAHLSILYQQQCYPLDCLPRFSFDDNADQQANGLLAPMPGRIIAQLCALDQTVEQNQPLLIMEAMKMEHTIRAPSAGTLRQYLCDLGSIVNEGDLLVDFEAYES